jgi:FixJ family two-component response regulator
MSRPIIVAVVEDDLSMRNGIERLLRAHGFCAAGFSSAEEFLAAAPSVNANCLVLDVGLGGMSGIDLRRDMTAKGDRTPTIFVTAIDSSTTIREAVEAGCVAYLLKPFLARDLLGAINRVVV